ncbi:MAG: hypothetical protein KDC52_14125 [Ignavibacteriae bacterium]|nr:hypothetical protein [Ignavibacteriota bacterium]
MKGTTTILNELLEKTSKHSYYQVIPECLSHLVNSKDLEIKSRWERERLEYILRFIKPKNKTFLDIGGNTGFFSFELLENGASKVYYYEGNKEHATFVNEASKLIGYQEKLLVMDKYFDFLDSKRI